MSEKYVYIDTETTNHNSAGALDPWSDGDIAVVQTNIDGVIEIRRWNDKTKVFLRRLVDEDYTFVFHNAEFDLRWLRKYGIKIRKVYDTMIASQVLNAGLTRVDEATRLGMRIEAQKIESFDESESLMEESEEFVTVKEKKATRFSHSLAATVNRYAGVKVVKDMGNSDWGAEELTPSQIRYAEEDVKHLPVVVARQKEYIAKFGLENVIDLEMRLIPATVDIMTNGILVDEDAWRIQIKEYERIAAELEKELNEAFGAELGEKMGGDDDSLLFGAQTMEFSVASPSQLLHFFDGYIIDGKPIESTDEATLKKIDHPLIPKLLKFKENRKLSTTYGEKFLAFRKKDFRIHAQLVQAETATGRFSMRYPSLQNIPADMIKGKIRARPGYMLVTMDYSAVEARILAYAAGDRNYIDTVNQTDIHKANAAKMFGIPVEDVTSAQRTAAKVLSFSIPLN